MRIDSHIHMVGNGFAGSECRIKLIGTSQKILARIMLKSLGIPYHNLKNGNLEKIYFDKLNDWIESSSLDAGLLLAQEHVYSENGKQEPELSSMYIPNNLVLEICKNNSKFIPAVSIHPARADGIEELEKCHEQGAKVMKCLPLYHKINCNNPAYQKFWQKMAELKMPLLVHTGGEKALPVHMPELADPKFLTLPLECGVNVIAAHAAATYYHLFHNYKKTICSMLREHKNLYVDNSGLHMPFRSLYFKTFFLEEFEGRVIHGSDLPVPISSTWAYLHRQISRKEHTKCRKQSNPIERDVLIKKALGFKEDTFTLLGKLIT